MLDRQVVKSGYKLKARRQPAPPKADRLIAANLEAPLWAAAVVVDGLPDAAAARPSVSLDY